MVQQLTKDAKPFDVFVEGKKINVLTFENGFEGDRTRVLNRITVSHAREIIKDLSEAIDEVTDSSLRGAQLFELVLEKGSQFLKIAPEQILDARKRDEGMQARQMIMSYLWDKKLFSLKTIGQFFAGRDHTTVIHSRDTVKDLCDVYDNYRETYQSLTDYLNKELAAVEG